MATTEVRYPGCTVRLVGGDGNAMVIMATVAGELKRHLRELDPEMPVAERSAIVDEFYAECMSGDYDHLLRTCMSWVVVE